MLCICKKEALGFENLNKHVKSKKKLCILWFGIAVPYLSHVRYIFIFLFGCMEKQNLKSLWRYLINFRRTLNLHTSHRKKELHF